MKRRVECVRYARVFHYLLHLQYNLFAVAILFTLAVSVYRCDRHSRNLPGEIR